MLETILIILFTAVFFLIAWRKLDWAIVLALLLLPSYLLRFQAWFVPMTILETMLLVLFIVWLIKTLGWHKNSLAEKFKSIWWPWKWSLLVFLLAGVLAVIISPDTRQALGLWKAYIIEPLLFFIVFINTIKTPKQIRSVLWALGAGVVLVGFGALLQYAGLASIPNPYGLETPMRATSVYPFPTAIGKLFGPAVALFLGILLVRGSQVDLGSKNDWDKKRGLFFVIGVIAFGAIGLLFSFSRGAMVGIFAAVIFLSFFSHWRKWIWAVLILLIGLALIIPQTRDNITGVFSATDVSTDVHLVMWRGAWRIIQDNPVLGTGLASFPVVYDKYKEASHTEFFPNPDNLILTLWIEMGLAGLLIFMWLVVRFFVAGAQIFRQEPLAIALMAAMIAIIAHGFLDTPYFKNDLAVQFWVLVGLMVALRHKYNSLAYS